MPTFHDMPASLSNFMILNLQIRILSSTASSESEISDCLFTPETWQTKRSALRRSQLSPDSHFASIVSAWLKCSDLPLFPPLRFSSPWLPLTGRKGRRPSNRISQAAFRRAGEYTRQLSPSEGSWAKLGDSRSKLSGKGEEEVLVIEREDERQEGNGEGRQKEKWGGKKEWAEDGENLEKSRV